VSSTPADARASIPRSALRRWRAAARTSRSGEMSPARWAAERLWSISSSSCVKVRHLDQPVEGDLGAARTAPAPHRALGPTTHPWRPAGAPRPMSPPRDQHEHLAHHPGPSLRPHRHRALHRTVGLWYGPFHSRTVRVILVCDDKPRTRDRDDRGYGLPLITTDLESSTEDLVARYASRWGIEQALADARHIVGVGEARNRTRPAVERTVPFGKICFSVVTLWYALHGHAPDEVTSHRTRARWYTTKTEPSYDDMAVKLRRVIIAARFRSPCPEQASPQGTRAVLAAWAAAGT